MSTDYITVKKQKTNDTASTASPNAVSSRHDFNVAIIGGGIGGLGLALALTLKGFAVAVFERDAVFEDRRQGYG